MERTGRRRVGLAARGDACPARASTQPRAHGGALGSMALVDRWYPQRMTIHAPVLASEILEWLKPQPGQIVVDGTLGGGGHTRLIAGRLAGGSGGSEFGV